MQGDLIITTREIKIRKNEIGFILWPENLDGKRYKTIKPNYVFIPTDDFEYIIDYFQISFPFTKCFGWIYRKL